MSITKRDIEKSLDAFEPDAREMFLALPEEERDAIIFSIETSNSNRIAVVERRQIDFEKDYKQYRLNRERRENDDGDEGNKMSTTQKIVKMIEEERAKQFNYGVWFRDRVLPQVISLITLAVLYLTFGGKLP